MMLSKYILIAFKLFKITIFVCIYIFEKVQGIYRTPILYMYMRESRLDVNETVFFQKHK